MPASLMACVTLLAALPRSSQEYTPDSVIGVNEPVDKNVDVSVFPNPCAEKLYILKNTKPELQQIMIRNSVGEIIQLPQPVKRKEGYLEINTTPLSPGIYFLVLTSGERKSVKKFMKN